MVFSFLLVPVFYFGVFVIPSVFGKVFDMTAVVASSVEFQVIKGVALCVINPLLLTISLLCLQTSKLLVWTVDNVFERYLLDLEYEILQDVRRGI